MRKTVIRTEIGAIDACSSMDLPLAASAAAAPAKAIMAILPFILCSHQAQHIGACKKSLTLLIMQK